MPPLIYFHLNITKIIQPLNLSDAITTDSYSKVRLASTIQSVQTVRPGPLPGFDSPRYSVSYLLG